MGHGRGLLSANDLKTLRTAVRTRREFSLTREWSDGSERILVSVVEADPAWGPAKMLVRLECWWGGVHSSQYFASVAEMEEAMRR